MATPACKRLTCTKCCGVDDCCPWCCQIPKKLYVTLTDPNGVMPCIDGISVELNYELSVGNYHFWTMSDDNLSPNGKALLCTNVVSYSRYYGAIGSAPDCNATKRNDCNGNLYLGFRLQLYSEKAPSGYPVPFKYCQISYSVGFYTDHKKSLFNGLSCDDSLCIFQFPIGSRHTSGVGDVLLASHYFDDKANTVTAQCSPFVMNVATDGYGLNGLNVSVCKTVNENYPYCDNTAVYYGAIADGVIKMVVTQ